MADVIISYAQKDSDLVRELGPAFEAECDAVWYSVALSTFTGAAAKKA